MSLWWFFALHVVGTVWLSWGISESTWKGFSCYWKTCPVTWTSLWKRKRVVCERGNDVNCCNKTSGMEAITKISHFLYHEITCDWATILKITDEIISVVLSTNYHFCVTLSWGGKGCYFILFRAKIKQILPWKHFPYIIISSLPDPGRCFPHLHISELILKESKKFGNRRSVSGRNSCWVFVFVLCLSSFITAINKRETERQRAPQQVLKLWSTPALASLGSWRQTYLAHALGVSVQDHWTVAWESALRSISAAAMLCLAPADMVWTKTSKS